MVVCFIKSTFIIINKNAFTFIKTESRVSRKQKAFLALLQINMKESDHFFFNITDMVVRHKYIL